MRLKTATAPLHERIDARIAQSSAFKSLSGYSAYLSRTFAVRKSMEDLLDSSQAQRLYPAWPDRRIAATIKLDLEDLGVVEPATDLQKRHPLGAGGIFGALYVLEGSAIGAKWVARQVQFLGAHSDHGRRHLTSQTSSPGAFNEFLSLLEAADLAGEQEEECLSAAIYTFECFERSYRSLA